MVVILSPWHWLLVPFFNRDKLTKAISAVSEWKFYIELQQVCHYFNHECFIIILLYYIMFRVHKYLTDKQCYLPVLITHNKQCFLLNVIFFCYLCSPVDLNSVRVIYAVDQISWSTNSTASIRFSHPHDIHRPKWKSSWQELCGTSET